MTPARPGDWWVSGRGAPYLVLGAGFGSRMLGASVEAVTITGHARPQVARVHLYPRMWRAITERGRRLDGPPTVNSGGIPIPAEVARALEMLEERACLI